MTTNTSDNNRYVAIIRRYPPLVITPTSEISECPTTPVNNVITLPPTSELINPSTAELINPSKGVLERFRGVLEFLLTLYVRNKGEVWVYE
jgi:hypothetical protein